jgi:Peptidase A4 family
VRLRSRGFLSALPWFGCLGLWLSFGLGFGFGFIGPGAVAGPSGFAGPGASGGLGGIAGSGALRASSADVRSTGRVSSAKGVFEAGYSETYASNWSGYAQHTDDKGRFTALEDDWVVPAVTPAATGTEYAAQWIGIGGYSDNTLVQAGILETAHNGKTSYEAWTEILPAPAVAIAGLTVSKGNEIKTVVEEDSTNRWNMSVYDLTTGKSGGRTVDYESSGESAEAILERPEVGSGLATLAKTTPVVFKPGYYSIAVVGHPSWKPLVSVAPASVADLTEIFMTTGTGTGIGGGKKVIATPSAPSSAGNGFSVADGTKSPSPPAD